MKKTAFTFVILCALLALQVKAQEPPQEVPSMKAHFQGKFEIGAAVNPFQLRGETGQFIARHYSALTAENCMKPEALWRPDGTFHFEQADTLVRFARENGMKLRGHTLVWHSQTPRAFFQDEAGNPLEKEALYARMEEYMTAVMNHFGDDVWCWDVVNEALADWGDDMYRKKSPWYEICGEDFIAQAFRTARKIAPNALLIYNDYGLINPEKREKAVKMLKWLKEQNVPIDGVGMQGHWNMYTFHPEELQKSIDAFTELGLQVQITEMDLSVYPPRFDRSKPAEKLEYTQEISDLQAEKYAQIFEVLNRNADKISCVTFWGISDRFTWLNGYPQRGRTDHPLLFDRDGNPKPAFYRVLGE